MKNSQIVLAPVDLVVALKLGVSPKDWKFVPLAEALGLSPSQVHASVERLVLSGLLAGKGLKGKISREALSKLLIHAVRYWLPPVLGGPARGVPTGPACELFESDLVARNTLALVWPSAHGKSRGTSLQPVHPCVPWAAQQDANLHKVLVHLDALRAGQARERDFAIAFLQKKFSWTS